MGVVVRVGDEERNQPHLRGVEPGVRYPLALLREGLGEDSLGGDMRRAKQTHHRRSGGLLGVPEESMKRVRPHLVFGGLLAHGLHCVLAVVDEDQRDCHHTTGR